MKITRVESNRIIFKNELSIFDDEVFCLADAQVVELRDMLDEYITEHNIQ